MNKSHFVEKYSTFSNFQLYEILQNKKDYQDVAVQAAKEEFERRQLSDSDMALVITEWKEVKNKKLRGEEKKRDIENKITDYRDKAIKDLDPFTPSSTDRSVRMLCICVGLIYLLTFYSSYQELLFQIKYWSTESFLFLPAHLPLALVPIGIWKFWTKKKSGWIILVAWLTLMLTGVLMILLPGLFITVADGFKPDDGFIINEIFSAGRVPLLFSILALLIYGALFIYLYKPAITTLFNISSNTKFYTLLATITLALCYLVIVMAM